MSTETKKPNKLTEKAGLTFNVNTMKHKLKDYYEGQSLTTPMFSGGHTAMTATLEKIWELLLQECLKKTGKDKSGVRQVNREQLQFSVLLHAGFRKYFVSHLENFDCSIQYKEQVPVIPAEMDKVMERVDKDMSLTPKARNLACFMLLKIFSQLASTCNAFLTFSKKKSLDGRCVLFAVSTLFHESISSELHTEIRRVMKEFDEEIEDQHTGDDEVPSTDTTQVVAEADAGDDEDAAPAETAKTTKKKGTKEVATKETAKKETTKDAKKGSTKATKKAVATIDEEPEEPEEAADAEEPEEEVKPTKKAAPAKKQATPAPKPKKK